MRYLILLFAVIFHAVAYSQSVLEERLKQHVYTLAADSLLGRKAGSEETKKAAAYIVEQWEEIGLAPLEGNSYDRPFQFDRYHNLVAIIEGNDPLLKDEYIIIGAHYDHLGTGEKNGETVIYNGADDNASGVATVIELGRQLMAIQPTLRRSVILIAFDAEEIGLFGSSHFANNPPVPVEAIKLMFSVDMVGWYKASGYIEYDGTGTIANGKQLLLDKNLIPEGLNVKIKNFENSIFTATDTEGFARKGIPTLAVTTGLKSPYHKPADEAHLIDYEGMTLITEHLTNIVKTVSQDETFQPSGKLASKHNTYTAKRFVFGIALNIGSNYHYYTKGARDGKPLNSTGIGLNGQVNLNFIAIRPELYYDFINAHHPKGDIYTQNITVPLNILLQTPPSSDVGVAVIFGPYYTYRLTGTQKNKKLDFKNDYYQDEFGFTYGVELRFGKIHLGYTARSAFTNFSQTKTDGANIRNRAAFFNLGYTF
jgi:hypothetical protein